MANEERGIRELCNTPERMATFRAKYGVPDDVALILKEEDDLTDGPEDSIMLPVTAISQAGIKFPLNSFLREVLYQLKASTNNATVNTLRILTAIGILKETEGLDFTIFDLFGVYSVNWNRTYERWYLQRLPGDKHDLILGLPDTNKGPMCISMLLGTMNSRPAPRTGGCPFPEGVGDLVGRRPLKQIPLLHIFRPMF
jgi:hypothetical protein